MLVNNTTVGTGNVNLNYESLYAQWNDLGKKERQTTHNLSTWFYYSE